MLVEVIVSLSDRREFIAEIVGVDPLSDLALLKVEGQESSSSKCWKQ
jgi:serine protease Do